MLLKRMTTIFLGLVVMLTMLPFATGKTEAASYYINGKTFCGGIQTSAYVTLSGAAFRSQTSAGDGSYAFFVPAGNYTVRASKSGCYDAAIGFYLGTNRVTNLYMGKIPPPTKAPTRVPPTPTKRPPTPTPIPYSILHTCVKSNPLPGASIPYATVQLSGYSATKVNSVGCYDYNVRKFQTATVTARASGFYTRSGNLYIDNNQEFMTIYMDRTPTSAPTTKPTATPTKKPTPTLGQNKKPTPTLGQSKPLTPTPTKIPTGTITGTIYLETTNGQRAYEGENVKVTADVLLGISSPVSTLSKSAGSYKLTGLKTTGKYTVKIAPPATYEVTTGNPVTAGTGEIVNFRMKLRSTAGPSDNVIKGIVFIDANKNKVMDSSENGASGVKVSISKTASKSVNSGIDGSYSFNDLAPGDYDTTIALPSGYMRSTSYIGVSLGGTTKNVTRNFGIYKPIATPTPTKKPTVAPTPANVAVVICINKASGGRLAGSVTIATYNTIALLTGPDGCNNYTHPQGRELNISVKATGYIGQNRVVKVTTGMLPINFFLSPTSTPDPCVANSLLCATPLPTKKPTVAPTKVPTKTPTAVPTIKAPTAVPTVKTPTKTPTAVPTKTPTPSISVPTITITPSPTTILTQTPTVTTIPTVTEGPTPTTIPTLTPIPTNTPTPNHTLITLNLELHGLGISGDNQLPNPEPCQRATFDLTNCLSNQNPIHSQRPVTVTVFTNDANKIIQTGTLTYDPAEGLFTGTIDLGTDVTTDDYSVYIQTGQYLSKIISGQHITSDETTPITKVTLVTGDANGDNAQSILDYTLLMGCYSDLQSAKACDADKQVTTDLNDDGFVNQQDYNLFLRDLVTHNGDQLPF